MNEIAFESQLQKDGTTMYFIAEANSHNKLEELAKQFCEEGKIIRYTAGSNFFFVTGEDTTQYNVPNELETLSPQAFKKLGFKVKFHRVSGKILLIARSSYELQGIIRLLTESGFMYTTQNGILNAILVKPNSKANIKANQKISVA